MSPAVSVVVVPRERFSSTQESLESILAHTDPGVELVYVDSRSPPPVRRYLEGAAAKYDFKLVRTERYLMPNQARNVGLAASSAPLVVFLDNDVVVEPGWLEPLVKCAEETGAWIVTPVTCIGRPEEELIHVADGRIHLRDGPDGTRLYREEMVHKDARLSEVRGQLERRRCNFAEFHCMLVRREAFDKLGPFDERMINTREHIDFCMAVEKAEGAIYFEPRSRVTQVPPWVRFDASDLPYYFLRWNDKWARATLERFKDKWGLQEDGHWRVRRWVTPHRRRVIVDRFEKWFRSDSLRRYLGFPLGLGMATALELIITPLARSRAQPQLT